MIDVVAILRDHYPSPVWCKCGWKAPLSLNDTLSDRNQTLGHVAEIIEFAVDHGYDTTVQICPLGIHGWSQATPSGRCPWCELEAARHQIHDR